MSSERLAQHYDDKYSAERGAHGTRIVRANSAPVDRHEACLTWFPRHFRGGSILEIGAGDGVIARSLIAADVAFDDYTATEYAEARLDGLARSLSDPRVRTARLDLEAPPGEHAGRYDAVILLATVEHLVDPIIGLRHVREMLRPGGFAFIDTPNIAKYSRRAKLLFGRFPATASQDEGLSTYAGGPVDLHDEGHLHYFTYRSLSRLLVERCGFSRTTRAPYVTAPHLFGRRIDAVLARLRPQLFAELCLVAYF